METMMAVGAGMILLGHALATGGSALREVRVFFLFMGSLQMLPLLYWAIKGLRTGRELLADPDTRITFRDNRVQLYRPEIKIREKMTVHNRGRSNLKRRSVRLGMSRYRAGYWMILNATE
jgi:hypothetical protein